MNANAPLASPPAIRLRPVERGDLPLLFEHASDPDSCRMAAVHPRDRKTFMALWDKILSGPTITARAILGDGEVVGSISCFEVDSQTYVGYWIARPHWGKRIATQALTLLLAEVPARPLHARVAADNVASMRVLEHCGFHVTGREHSPGTDRLVECEEILLSLP